MAEANVDGRGGVLVGGGASLREVGTISVDPANQGGAGFFDTDITIADAAVGDLILVQPPETLEDTLRMVGAAVQAANTLRIRMEATGAVDGAARDWAYLWFDLT